MSVNTIMADFAVSPDVVKDEGQVRSIVAAIENILRAYFPQLRLSVTQRLDGGTVNFYICKSSTVNLKVFDDGLITVTADHKGNEHDWMMEFKNIDAEIRKQIATFKQGFTFCPIKRGNFIRYLYTTDDRLVECDIDELVYEEQTPYQKIQILHSRTLGNILLLDGLQNISEGDLIYTETLMARGIEDYANKEVLILGGGDGALLYELLKEKPKNVIMIEIDQAVMDACSKYMSKVCGEVLKTKKGSNYEIIVADCLTTLDKFVNEGRKFDYIFGDLTDVPISETPHGEMWDFINKTLSTCFQIMKPSAKFMTHLTASIMEDALQMYEEQVKKLNPNIIYTTSQAYVPSFFEDWVFAQVALMPEN